MADQVRHRRRQRRPRRHDAARACTRRCWPRARSSREAVRRAPRSPSGTGTATRSTTPTATSSRAAGLVFSGTSPDGRLVEFVELPRERAPVLRRHPGAPGAASRARPGRTRCSPAWSPPRSTGSGAPAAEVERPRETRRCRAVTIRADERVRAIEDDLPEPWPVLESRGDWPSGGIIGVRARTWCGPGRRHEARRRVHPAPGRGGASWRSTTQGRMLTLRQYRHPVAPAAVGAAGRAARQAGRAPAGGGQARAVRGGRPASRPTGGCWSTTATPPGTTDEAIRVFLARGARAGPTASGIAARGRGGRASGALGAAGRAARAGARRPGRHLLDGGRRCARCPRR